MGENSLSVELRDRSGKGAARKLRGAGRVPAVLYGRGNAPLPLSFEPKVLESLLQSSDAGLNTLIDLAGDAAVAGKTVLIKEVQRDPVRGGMLHADLFEVDQEQKVTVSVPLHLVGTARGVALSGGLVDHAMREIELECLPRAIPDEIHLDVSDLDLGDSLHVRDVILPEGVSLRSDANLSIVSVVAPSVSEAVEEVAEGVEEEAAAEAAAAEGDEKPDSGSTEKQD